MFQRQWSLAFTLLWSRQKAREYARRSTCRHRAAGRAAIGGMETGKLADLTAFVESERTNPVRLRWQELRNTLSKRCFEPVSQ